MATIACKKHVQVHNFFFVISFIHRSIEALIKLEPQALNFFDYNKQIVRCLFDRFFKRAAARHLASTIVVLEKNKKTSLIYMRIPIDVGKFEYIDRNRNVSTYFYAKSNSKNSLKI